MYSGRESPTTEARFGLVSVALGVSGALLALVALFGWGLDVPALRTFGVLNAEMTPLTALWLLALSVCVVLLRWRGRFRRVIVVVSGLVGVTGLIVGIEHLFDAEFGIDNLMWGERVLLSGFAHPGRPSVQTTISVLLVAIGIVAYAVQRDRRIGVAGALGVVAGYIALEALLGYAFGIEAFYSSVGLGAGAMSVPTALAVLFASVGLLLYPLADVWPELTSDRLSWRMMWRLLPVVLAAPIINVLAQGFTLTRGPGVEFLSSLVGAAILGIMVGVVWSVGRDVRRLSFRREEAMAEASTGKQCYFVSHAD
jgi:hypothetical protein